jgi:glutathione S-transferase
MNVLDIVTALVLLQFLVFGALVGQARGKYGVKAPAVTGSEMFERAYRVQMNTLELMVCLVPAMYLAARYWNPLFPAAAGAVYLIGRVLYRQAYVSAPDRRGLGFMLSFLPILVLLVATLVGAL